MELRVWVLSLRGGRGGRVMGCDTAAYNVGLRDLAIVTYLFKKKVT